MTGLNRNETFVALLVGHAIGLDVTDEALDNIHLHRGHGAALAESLGRIQRTAEMVLSAMDIADTRDSTYEASSTT